MDLNRVAAFVRVVTDGSFTAAARSLGLPKSSVSRSVSQLEQDLGIRLLHRTTRQLHLTDAGAAFYERASHALTDIDEATTAAAEAQTELSGVVRLTAPTDLGIWALAPLVRRFTRKHPGIRVELKLTGRVVDLVAEGVDLAVRAGPLRDSSLIARRVGDIESFVYASPRYLARRGTPAAVAELAEHECVLFRPVNGRSTWALASADGAETAAVDVTGAIGCDDLSYVRASVMSGAGVGLLPSFILVAAERTGRVRRVLPSWSTRSAPLHIAYPSARFVPQRVVALREHLLRGLGSLVHRV
ncbi:MAG: Transcriptional regulator, LysR family [Labilithrix sp.]|nr:Transcriptional regulator, LysR family [Labilithrix sp.]